MSGFMLCHGACIGCGILFAFNPNRVPSLRVNGLREPVCAACVATANLERVKNGLAPIVVLPGAYDAAAADGVESLWEDMQ